MSRMASPQYETGRIAERCAATGEALKPGDPFVAALIQVKGEESLIRRDFTPKGWAGQPKPAGLFATWSGVVPASEKSKGTAIDTASLLGLFEQLAETDDPKRQAFRYVLALILMRKRVLMPMGSREANGDKPGALLVRPRGSQPEEPPIEVIDPAMDEATVGEITDQLRTLLRIEA
ncbi:MAG: hypothetical protein JNK58_09365 [Phycisphaerae bacterium]|nr:hypothetical protein [Phycisphaerae bacterium]